MRTLTAVFKKTEQAALFANSTRKKITCASVTRMKNRVWVSFQNDDEETAGYFQALAMLAPGLKQFEDGIIPS